MKKITRVLKYFELNGNKSIIYQNLWDTVKSVVNGKFIALNEYILKRKKWGAWVA